MATHIPSKQQLSHEPVPSLLAGVLHDAKDLAVSHLGHMRDEIKDELGNLKRAMLRIAVAVGVVVVGAVLGGHALATALVALGVAVWASYLIAAAIAAGGGILYLKRISIDRKDVDLIPENSFHDLQADVAQVSDAITK